MSHAFTQSLSYYLECFDRLNCAKHRILGVAPHKPILLLSIIRLFEHGSIRGCEIEISDELEAMFYQVWQEYVHTRHHARFALPFYHMQTEPFWFLNINEPHRLLAQQKDQMRYIKQLKKAVHSASIDDALADYLADERNRDILREFLVVRYFSPPKLEQQQASDSNVQDFIKHLMFVLPKRAERLVLKAA
ncbi:hypothetical protein LVJ83_12385 [Uruburuella testudinis]|uniref:Uncharacterized protein n=1 Tax=Uruburuella testudinis TaxID=1282863 RepID=A0ABY4DTH4_9NEIS|nr:hypothetical protein [Uruburuella testudinis]UOO81703.1 hypothetical protein LVJ83_12385 [Uruburuella testudinis]